VEEETEKTDVAEEGKVPPVLVVRAMSRAVVAVRRSGGCAHTVVVVVVTYLGGVVAAVVVVVVATRWAAWAAATGTARWHMQWRGAR